MHNFLSKYNINFKDLRTWGVNKTFIDILKKKTSTNNWKKIFNETLKECAEIINHSTSISKSNYLIDEMVEYVKFIVEKKKVPDLNSLINFIS